MCVGVSVCLNSLNLVATRGGNQSCWVANAGNLVYYTTDVVDELRYGEDVNLFICTVQHSIFHEVLTKGKTFKF